MCKSWCELILGIVVIVFALWQIPNVSQWIVVLIGVVILVHSLTCKCCFSGEKIASASKKRR